MVEEDIEMNIQSPSNFENEHIEKALEILDNEDWINMEQFLQPWGTGRITLVHLAAYRGNLEILKHAVDLGLYLYAKDKVGRCALHYAASQGSIDVVRWLLEQPAGAPDETECSASDQISLEDIFGMTALDLAEKGGHLDVVKLLMEIRFKETAHFAAKMRHPVGSSLQDPPPPLPLLNQNDYEESIYGISGIGSSLPAALTLALNKKHPIGSSLRDPLPPPPSLNQDDYEEAIYGISGGGPPRPASLLLRPLLRHQGRYGKTIPADDPQPIYENIQSSEKDKFLEHWQVDPIHLAAYGGELDILRSSTCLDREDKLGKCALHYAAEQGHINEVKYLVERLGAITGGPNGDKLSKLLRQDTFGMSALHYAADQGHLAVVKYLVEDSIDAIGEEKMGKLSQLSLGDRSGRTPLHLAVGAKHLAIVEFLVNAGADVDARDKHGIPPILMAHYNVDRNDDEMISRYETIVSFLVSRDAPVFSFHPRTGWTVLHYAAKLNSRKATRWLSKYHASLVWHPGSEHVPKDTPVHVAAANNSNGALAILLKISPTEDIDLPNTRGFTPLHAAASTCNLEGVRILIDNGGNLANKNHSGDTPVDILSDHKDDLDVVELLRDILSARIHLWKRNDFNPILKRSSFMVLDFKILGPKDELQMAVVSALIKALSRENQIPILQHPLVNTYITLKWSRLHYFFGSLLLIRLLFAVFLSCYAIYLQEDSVASIIGWIIFFFAVILLCYNMLQFFTEPKSYCKKIETWLYTLCLITAIIATVHGFIYTTMVWWIPYAVSIIIPLIWIQTMLLAGRLSGWVFNTLIFPTALMNFLKVFLVGFLSIIVGFAFSFSILLHGNEEFNSPWKAFVKSVLMMTGEYEFGDLFGNETRSIVHYLAANESEKTYGPMISRGVFLIFVILTSVVLMNLMIGLAVSDIQGLVKEGDFSRLLKQAEFIAECEQMAKVRIFRNCLVPRRLPDLLKSRLPEVLKAIPFSLRKLPNNISMNLMEDLYNIGSKNQKNEEKPLATT